MDLVISHPISWHLLRGGMGRVGGARRQALNLLRPRAAVQLYSDCLDSAPHGLVAVDAARVVSRSRLVVIEKSRLAAADCAAHAGKAPMQRGLGSTVQAPDSDDIWASSMDSEFKMDSSWKLAASE